MFVNLGDPEGTGRNISAENLPKKKPTSLCFREKFPGGAYLAQLKRMVWGMSRGKGRLEQPSCIIHL